MKICHTCKNELIVSRIVGRRDACPRCGADLHCCLNCGFYERNASKQCREPVAEFVKNKEQANFCDYFSMSERVFGEGTSAANAQARKSLDDLFKK